MSATVTALVLMTVLTTAPVRVGSKAFTESVVLGELVRQTLVHAEVPAVHLKELGGTRILWEALTHDQLDVYPEYTGTLRQEIFNGTLPAGEGALRAALAKAGVVLGPSLGFENTYALGMKAARAEALHIRKISELAQHPELRLGFSHEFLDRADGWRGLSARYGLNARNPRGLSHELAYPALDSGALDVTDLYSTDAEIKAYGLRVLEDDAHYFPEYRAVLLYRQGFAGQMPRAIAAVERIAGRVDTASMVALNAEVKLERHSEAEAASHFLHRVLGDVERRDDSGLVRRVLDRTLEHLILVALSLGLALLVALPLGIFSARWPRPGQGVLAVVGIFQTLPSLAILVFMIPLLGIGTRPAIGALFLYSLLPIVRNTYAGLLGIPADLRESARALGLPAWTRLGRVELPLAAGSILAGIKTAAIINVGTATLGALVGAGGYGQPILAGIRLARTPLILEGALPAAVLALLVQGVFELAERRLVPRGVT